MEHIHNLRSKKATSPPPQRGPTRKPVAIAATHQVKIRPLKRPATAVAGELPRQQLPEQPSVFSLSRSDYREPPAVVTQRLPWVTTSSRTH
jgi:hypothetical protein